MRISDWSSDVCSSDIQEDAMRAVIFDLDGTICDPSGRLYHLDGEKDWKSFHAAAGDDTPIDPIVPLVRLLFKAAEAGDGLDAVLIVPSRHDEPNHEQSTRHGLQLEKATLPPP